jgi:hypothetical protein
VIALFMRFPAGMRCRIMVPASASYPKIAQMAAQLQDQRSLARADRTADAHGEGPLPPVPGGPHVVRARLAHRKGADAVIMAAVPTHATEEAKC